MEVQMESYTETKQCNQCGQIFLATSEFFRPRSMDRGFEAVCKLCQKENVRARYHAKRDSGWKRDQTNSKIKMRLREHKIGKSCVDCGYMGHPVALDFDHLPGEQKSFNIGQAVKQKGMTTERLDAELQKCELVCANCHRIRTLVRDAQTIKRKPRKPVDSKIASHAAYLQKKITEHKK
jgi:hypothetical protein